MRYGEEKKKGGGGGGVNQGFRRRIVVTQDTNYDNIPVKAKYFHCTGVPLYMTFLLV